MQAHAMLHERGATLHTPADYSKETPAHTIHIAAKTSPQPPAGGRGSLAPHKGPGTHRSNADRNPSGPSRPSAPYWLVGFRRGGGGRGCGPGSCVVRVCVSEGSFVYPSPLSTVSGTVGGVRNRCSPPADRARVDGRAYENLPELQFIWLPSINGLRASVTGACTAYILTSYESYMFIPSDDRTRFTRSSAGRGLAPRPA